MNKITLIAAMMFLAACSTGKKGVNETKVRPPTEVFGMFSSGKETATGVKPAAIAGKVVLTAEMQRPLAGVTVGVYRRHGIELRHITDFSTGIDGTFSVNKALEPGDYELRIQSPKYEGKLAITLTKPDTDLVIEAVQKN
jgi:5-hydroxyisourate hydrolase-like protein (transthyretin family)